MVAKAKVKRREWLILRFICFNQTRNTDHCRHVDDHVLIRQVAYRFGSVEDELSILNIGDSPSIVTKVEHSFPSMLTVLKWNEMKWKNFSWLISWRTRKNRVLFPWPTGSGHVTPGPGWSLRRCKFEIPSAPAFQAISGKNRCPAEWPFDCESSIWRWTAREDRWEAIQSNTKDRRGNTAVDTWSPSFDRQETVF